MKYLVKETTKQERKELIDTALGRTMLGGGTPSNDILQLAEQYIEGNIELEIIEKAIDEKYK